MKPQKGSLAHFLLKSPWSVSASLGVLVFVAMRWVIPAGFADDPKLQPFAIVLIRLAPLSLVLFGLFAFLAVWLDAQRRRRAEGRRDEAGNPADKSQPPRPINRERAED